MPIEVTADSWEHFYLKEAFNSFRILCPSPISVKNFRSSIVYLKKNSIKGRLAEIIDTYKLPILYQYVFNRRKKRLDGMLNHFAISNKPSPIYEGMTSANNV